MKACIEYDLFLCKHQASKFFIRRLLPSLLIVGVSLFSYGCRSTPKTSQNPDTQKAVLQVPDELVAPVYIFDKNDKHNTSAATLKNLDKTDVNYWISIARADFQKKRFSRALRATDEALLIDNDNVEARKIAMLASAYITQTNVQAYHNASVMDAQSKDSFKQGVSKITTLVNSSVNRKAETSEAKRVEGD